MRTRIVIIVCCAFVAGLAVGWFSGTGTASKSRELRSASVELKSPKPGTRPKVGARVFDWSNVESEDYLEYISNLRRIGCPEQTIKDIIKADVNALFQTRASKVLRSMPQGPYWQNTNLVSTAMNGQSATAIARLEEERQEVLRILLGQDSVNDAGSLTARVLQDTVYSFIPADKRQSVLKLLGDYDMERIRRFGAIVQGRDAIMELRQMDIEKERALAAILTPEELFEYQVRFSSTAEFARSELAEFEPSETEFRQIIRSRQRVADSIAQIPEDASPDVRRSLVSESLRAANADLSMQLGEKRWMDYSREQDGNYKAIRAITVDGGLGKREAHDAYAIHLALLERLENLAIDRNLDSATHNQMRQETLNRGVAELRQMLGDQGASEYLRTFERHLGSK